jgi:uncharacterized protein YbjT (DUF2867 family)
MQQGKKEHLKSRKVPNMKSAVFAIVSNAIQAEAVVDELRMAGFSNNDVSVLFPDVEGTQEFAHAKSTKAPEGAVIGAGAGSLLGAAAGWLLGLGTLAIPGVGPIIAAGPIFAALSGAALGGAAGGLSGALAGLGFPEYEAKLYAGKLQDGNILIAAHTENVREEKVAREIFERADAHDIGITTETPVPSR